MGLLRPKPKSDQTNLYFSLMYGSPTEQYLALFALTPHPFNSDPSRELITEADLVKQVNKKNPVPEGYTSDQVSSARRKNMLRPKALKLTEESSVIPGKKKGDVLLDAYQQMRSDVPKNEPLSTRQAIKRVAAYLTPADALKEMSEEKAKNVPKVTTEQFAEARGLLAKNMKLEDWENLENQYAALDEIRQGGTRAVTNQAVLGEKDRARARLAAAPGQNPRDVLPPYIDNPEIFDVNAQRDPKIKKQPVRLSYSPSVSKEGQQTAVQTRLEQIRLAKKAALDNNFNSANIANGNLPVTSLDPTEQQILAQQAFNKPAINVPVQESAESVAETVANTAKKAKGKAAAQEVLESMANNPTGKKGFVEGAKDFYKGVTNLSPGQRRALGGLVGGSAVLAGGLLGSSVITNNVIKGRREEQLRRQQEEMNTQQRAMPFMYPPYFL